MPSTVGKLEISPRPTPERRWAIGGAPNSPPYWTLLNNATEPAARMVIAFADFDDARHELGAWLDRTSRSVDLKHFVERTIYDLNAAPDATIAEVTSDTPELRAWLDQVVAAGHVALPDELQVATADVLFLPRIAGSSGQLALVAEEAWGGRVSLMRPRPLRWQAEPA